MEVYQRCVGDMVTKKTLFFRGSSLVLTQSAQVCIAISMALIPSNSSHTLFSSLLHLKKETLIYIENNQVLLTPLCILLYLPQLNRALSPPQVCIENQYVCLFPFRCMLQD